MRRLELESSRTFLPIKHCQRTKNRKVIKLARSSKKSCRRYATIAVKLLNQMADWSISSRTLRWCLGLAVIRGMGLKVGEEAWTKAVHEGLTHTDGKHFLVDENERAGCSQNLCVVIEHRWKDCIAMCILVGLLNVIENCVGLLWISRAELIEQVFKDGRSGNFNDLFADLGLDCTGSGIGHHSRSVDIRTKQVDGVILKSHTDDVTLKLGNRHGTKVRGHQVQVQGRWWDGIMCPSCHWPYLVILGGVQCKTWHAT